MTTGENSPRPGYRFYGRKKGLKLSQRQAGLLNSLLPVLRIDLNDPLADPSQNTWLEIGFGGGEHLTQQAIEHPNNYFIGIEPFQNGVAKLLVAIEEKNLANIRIHDGDARDLLPKIRDGSVERIFLLYPDPWPKKRHRKRRFVNVETVTHFHRMLKPGGVFRFASDIEDYVLWTVAMIRQHGGFSFNGKALKDWRLPPQDWHRTRYEQKALREGRVPAYLSFRKPPA